MSEAQQHADEGSVHFWAAAAHLAGFGGLVLPWLGQMLFPLLVWAVKKNLDPLVEDQAVESLNFGVTMALLDAAIWIVLFTYGMELVFLLVIATAIQSIFLIIAAAKAHGGARYRYPICLRIF